MKPQKFTTECTEKRILGNRIPLNLINIFSVFSVVNFDNMFYAGKDDGNPSVMGKI